MQCKVKCKKHLLLQWWAFLSIKLFWLISTKTKVITLANDETQRIQWTNQNSKQIHITGAKCGEMLQESHSWLRFGFSQSQSRLSQSRSFVSGSGVGVGPGTNDFYLLQHAKFTGGFFLLWCYPIRTSVFKLHVDQAISRAQDETWNLSGWIKMIDVFMSRRLAKSIFHPYMYVYTVTMHSVKDAIPWVGKRMKQWHKQNSR